MYYRIPAARAYLPGIAGLRGLGDTAGDLSAAQQRLAETRNALTGLRAALVPPGGKVGSKDQYIAEKAWRVVWAQKLGIDASRPDWLMPQSSFNSIGGRPPYQQLEKALAAKREEANRIEADVRNLELQVSLLQEKQRREVLDQKLIAPVAAPVAPAPLTPAGPVTIAAPSSSLSQMIQTLLHPTDPQLKAPTPQQLPAPGAATLPSAGSQPIPVTGGDQYLPAVPPGQYVASQQPAAKSKLPLILGGGAALVAVYLFS